MGKNSKKLTTAQAEKFLKDNRHGILAFGGNKPYALPMGYLYKRKTILIGLVTTGRKMKYLKENKNVCFTVSKPRWETTDLKVPCTSIVGEGTLEEVKNKSYYGIKTSPPKNIQLFKIVRAKRGTRKCTRKPCELFAAKKGKA
jgi:nitroimidazol reductase NimA-like FMN-containing flavoprotein (pyridoxamine 5'-phosphate oxidase superfamily)